MWTPFLVITECSLPTLWACFNRFH